MDLAHAIEQWVAARGDELPTSLREDIDNIAGSVDRQGFANTPCADLDDDARKSIAAAAANDLGALKPAAVAEFLAVVGRWAADRDEGPDLGSDADVNDDDAAGLDDSSSSLDQDEVNLDDDETEAGEEDDKLDQDENDDLDASENGDTDDGDEEDDSEDLHEDDEADDRDDLDQDEDDALATDDLDDEPEEEAASSFFETLGSSPAGPSAFSTPALQDATTELSTSEQAAGAFSDAAQRKPSLGERGIDWVTVGYFSVAAICFALVIILYWFR